MSTCLFACKISYSFRQNFSIKNQKTVNHLSFVEGSKWKRPTPSSIIISLAGIGNKWISPINLEAAASLRFLCGSLSTLLHGTVCCQPPPLAYSAYSFANQLAGLSVLRPSEAIFRRAKGNLLTERDDAYDSIYFVGNDAWLNCQGFFTSIVAWVAMVELCVLFPAGLAIVPLATTRCWEFALVYACVRCWYVNWSLRNILWVTL